MQTSRWKWSGLSFAWAGLVASVALGLCMWAYPALPERVATHWSGSVPDGWSSRGEAIMFVTLFPLCMGAVFAGVTAAVGRGRAIMAGLATGFATGLAVAMTADVLRQKGLSDTSHLSLGWPYLVLGLVTGLGVGAATYALARRDEPDRLASNGSRPRLEWGTSSAQDRGVQVQERTAATMFGFIGRTRFGKEVLYFLVPILGLNGVVTVVLVASGNVPWFVPGMVALFLVGALALFLAPATVTAGRSGVAVRSWRFVRWAHYSIEAIDHAELRVVDPMADFGGWGLRNDLQGNSGFITASGEAATLHLTSGKTYTITAQDSKTLAATINSLCS